MMQSYLFETLRGELLIAACVLLLVVIWKSYLSRWRKLPPGPIGLPILGYIPFLTKKPHLKFMQLGQKYGDVFSLQFGAQTTVVLNSAQVIREALVKPELLGRPDQSRFFIVPIKSPFFASGKVWQEHRRFAFRVFKELESGTAMEEHIKTEIERFIKFLKDQDGSPFEVSRVLSSCVANYITALSFGKRYEFDDPERMLLDEILEESSKRIGSTSAVAFFPWMKNVSIFRKLLDLDTMLKLYTDFVDLTQKKVQEHKEAGSESSPKDFIDFYFSELSTRNGKNSNTTFSEKFLPDSLQALYGTGTETVRTSLTWCFYTMAVYREVQEKVQKEIDEVIGHERAPSLSDQKNMRYTQSVLMEIQRWQTVVPLGVVRMALSDTTIGQYEIPKGTYVMPNLWAAHHDPRCWKEPEEFIPERFLGPDGNIIKNENYMPFSVGRRNCLGEGIAVVEVFLYFTCILQKFKIKLPEGDKPDFGGFGAITYQMNPRKLCFESRDN